MCGCGPSRNNSSVLLFYFFFLAPLAFLESWTCLLDSWIVVVSSCTTMGRCCIQIVMVSRVARSVWSVLASRRWLRPSFRPSVSALSCCLSCDCLSMYTYTTTSNYSIPFHSRLIRAPLARVNPRTVTFCKNTPPPWAARANAKFTWPIWILPPKSFTTIRPLTSEN